MVTSLAWAECALGWLRESERFPSARLRFLRGAMFCLRCALASANRTQSAYDPAITLFRMMNWVRAEMKRAEACAS